MVVSRSAIIITNPGEVGSEGYCEGVNKDAQLYRSFLLSPVGGAWLSGEIFTLKQPAYPPARLSAWAMICFQIDTSSVSVHSCRMNPFTR